MNKQIEDLYYKCIEKIDDDVEKAEYYLIGCITFLCRQTHGRADRDRIAEDFSLNRGLEKYVEELTIISRLPESSLSTLIASSLDLSMVIKNLSEIVEKAKGAIYDDVQSYGQTTKIKKAMHLLSELNKLVKEKKYCRRQIRK